MLFLLTERYKFCVLEYNAEGKLVTVAKGDVEDTIGRPAECGHLCVVDDDTTMIGLHMYDGHFKIIPIDEDGGISEQAFNVRLDELKVMDLAFVGNGTLGVLHEDTKGARHLKTYKVSKGGVLEEGGMKVANVDGGMILGLGGVGGDGCLVVGKQVWVELG
jgi:DNA damage-binding protein 1